jgi:hypothetical protein
MVTRSGANQYRGTGQLPVLDEQDQRAQSKSALTFTPAGKALYETGRSHNLALTAGGPIVIPKVVDGRNKLFFFANYSHVTTSSRGRTRRRAPCRPARRSCG